MKVPQPVGPSPGRESARNVVGYTHAGITVRVSSGEEGRIVLEATKDALWAWANRPGRRWPGSRLEDIDDFRATFNRRGLVRRNDEISNADVSAEEFNAFTSDVLAGVLPVNHPAYHMTVGQFERDGV